MNRRVMDARLDSALGKERSHGRLQPVFRKDHDRQMVSRRRVSVVVRERDGEPVHAVELASVAGGDAGASPVGFGQTT